MRRLCVDQANAFIAEQKNEHNFARAIGCPLARASARAVPHCKHAAGRVQGLIACW